MDTLHFKSLRIGGPDPNYYYTTGCPKATIQAVIFGVLLEAVAKIRFPVSCLGIDRAITISKGLNWENDTSHGTSQFIGRILKM